eukprot:4046711-Pyramimonas_sp.AAC.1
MRCDRLQGARPESNAPRLRRPQRSGGERKRAEGQMLPSEAEIVVGLPICTRALGHMGRLHALKRGS